MVKENPIHKQQIDPVLMADRFPYYDLDGRLAAPRDDQGRPGPYEAALLDNPVADPELPLEVLRTVHSFDPCIACAIHMTDPLRRPIVSVKAF